MEMRAINLAKEVGQGRREYIDNIHGYIFMAKENKEKLIISEGNTGIICDAKDFWKITNIDIMDIEEENSKFKSCEYIKNFLKLEYDNRIIKIKTTS